MKKLKLTYEVVRNGIKGLKTSFFHLDRYGYLAKTSHVNSPTWGAKQNVYIYDHCGINCFSKFLCTTGNFIMKRNCSVGTGLTVITFNHQYNTVGQFPENREWANILGNDVIVNEDVWIGANVTLCPGTIIGRGSIIAAGSVCIKSQEYPPYSVIGGNPAKFIKFRLSLEDQIKQEELRYNDKEKTPLSELKNKFKEFTKL